LAIINLLSKLGSGFDIVSIGELERVIAAGGDPKLCVFSGVAKTHFEIEKSLEHEILCFNVESKSELERIEFVAKQKGVKAPISIRVNPDVDAKTHPYISTGMKKNKFGVDADEAIGLYRYAKNSSSLEIVGIDCHIGSQITDDNPFVDALDKVLELVEELIQIGINLKHIDLGGGIGIQYDNESTIDIETYINKIKEKVGNIEVILEPGRSIVGNAGVLLTKVEYIKSNPEKSFAIVDAAMNDLLRPALYDAYHEILNVDTLKKESGDRYDIVGPVCETGDFIARDREISLEEGDLLAIMSVGAYGYSMTSNYNSRPRPPEVMVSGNKHYLIRERETLDDLFNKEHIINE
jgi:diaminopimelate decarboxylase